MSSTPKANDLEALQSLMAAVQRGSVDDLRRASTAFASGASTIAEIRDERGRRCAHTAAARGDVAIINALVSELGCDADARDDEGFTPLMTAASMGAIDAVRAFIALGADAKARTSSGAGVLHQMVMGSVQGGFASSRETCARALDALSSGTYGLDIPDAIEQKCENVGTPLIVAAMRGCSGMLEELLERGASVKATMRDGGASVVTFACASGDVESVRVLIAAGADVNATPQGNMTPLHIAAAHMNTEKCAEAMARVLLDAGANADVADSSGLKAVHAAAATKRRSVVELLLPRTTPDEGITWTSDGVIKHVAAQLEAMQNDDRATSNAPPAASTTEAFAVKDSAAAEKTRRQGNEMFVAGDYKGAEKAYTESLAQDGSCAKTWANRAAARLKLKSYADAKADAKNSRALDPMFVKAWYREGEAALALNEYEDAALAFFEGLQIDGDSAELKRMFDLAIARGRAASKASAS